MSATPTPEERERWRLISLGRSADRAVHFGERVPGPLVTLCAYDQRQAPGIHVASEYEAIAAVCVNCREVAAR